MIDLYYHMLYNSSTNLQLICSMTKETCESNFPAQMPIVIKQPKLYAGTFCGKVHITTTSKHNNAYFYVR